jgi:hypothetical protein
LTAHARFPVEPYRHQTWFATFGIALLCLSGSSPVMAQAILEPDTSHVRVELGPVGANPTIELTNLGVDTNVFNDPPGAEKRDFTFTLTPKADLWMKAGRTWITGSVREDLIWYQEYSSERSANTSATLGWVVPLNRVAFAVSGGFVSSHQRPGFEIDGRVPRRELLGTGRAEYRVLARTYIGVSGQRQRVEFDQDAEYQGVNLDTELSRVSTSEALTLRHQLTPLTSISLDAGRVQDRFEFSPLRDADSTTAGAAVTFDPSALIKGSARFGYRNFSPADRALPGYKGFVTAVDLAYSLLGTTRFGVTLTRDIQYSYDQDQPYYLQSGVAASVAQQIYGPLDAVARIGFQQLEYRDRAGAPVQVPGRTDDVRSYGGGAGYHFGHDLRIGVNVDKQRRTSEVFQRRYDGLRVGVSMTYGL